MSASFNVLLIESDAKQTEFVTELVREIAPTARVDVLARPESLAEWISAGGYHLAVVSESATNGVDGVSVLEQIKRMSPAAAVILISEDATVEGAVAAIRLGAEEYLRKPFSVEAFRLAVKRGLDRKTVLGQGRGLAELLNLMSSCQMISASLDERKVLEIVQAFLLRELRSVHGATYVLRRDPPRDASEPGPEPTPVRILPDASTDASVDQAMEEILDIALAAANPLPQMAARNESYRFVERGQLTPGLFVFRFRCAGPNDCFAVCLSPHKPADRDGLESRLRMLRTQIELTGRNIDQYRGVEKMAYLDDATGLYNTRYLNAVLDREVKEFEASRRSFAVLFIDADRFKGINDRHGHLVGTKLLNELGKHLRRFVRESDTVFRYGGDEFIAVLSGCDLPTASKVAERIRSSVEHSSFLSDEGLDIRFTVSIGVALFPDHAGSKKEIIEAADRAMYASKHRARNAVTLAGPASASPAPAKPESSDG